LKAMQKFQVKILLLCFILPALAGSGQSNYQLQIRCPDREAAPFIAQAGLQTSFSSRFTCN